MRLWDARLGIHWLVANSQRPDSALKSARKPLIHNRLTHFKPVPIEAHHGLLSAPVVLPLPGQQGAPF